MIKPILEVKLEVSICRILSKRKYKIRIYKEKKKHENLKP